MTKNDIENLAKTLDESTTYAPLENLQKALDDLIYRAFRLDTAWLNTLPEDQSGIVYRNELLDAQEYLGGPSPTCSKRFTVDPANPYGLSYTITLKGAPIKSIDVPITFKTVESPGCECGALKLGYRQDNVIGHSDWCPIVKESGSKP